MNIEELAREAGPLILMKDVKTWFEINAGKDRTKGYYDCYKAGSVRLEEDGCVHIYILNGGNEHKEVVYPKRNVRVEQRAIPIIVLKGKPLIKREIESSRSAKAKNKHSRKLLEKIGITEREAKKIQVGGLFDLPEIGLRYERI